MPKRKPPTTLQDVIAARVAAGLNRGEVARHMEPRPMTRHWLLRVERGLIRCDWNKMRRILEAITRAKKQKTGHLYNQAEAQAA